jgi:hypothetical protein
MTGIAVLLYNAGDALGSLWIVCCCGGLGRWTHSNTPLLLPPKPPSFTPEFAWVKFKLLPLVLLWRHEYGRKVHRNKLAMGMRSERIVEEDSLDVVELGGEERFG